MRIKEIVSLFTETGKDFLADDCPTQAAALSYYTIFALPPLLAVVLLILGLVLSIPILWTIGIILLIVGLVLMLVGRAGHAVGGRSHYY